MKNKLDKRQLVALRAAGWSYARIAKYLGVNPNAVWEAINRIKKCPHCGEALL